MRGDICDGLNKSAYWCSAVSLLSDVCGQLWHSAVFGEPLPELTPTLTDDGMQCAFEFFSIWYLFGGYFGRRYRRAGVGAAPAEDSLVARRERCGSPVCSPSAPATPWPRR